MTAKFAELLGRTRPYAPLGVPTIGFVEFFSPFQINGLVQVSDDRLEFLAFISLDEGKGNFRNFIAACKKTVPHICIWEVWNPALKKTLKRYGFTKARTLDGNGGIVVGMQWKGKHDA